MKKSKLEKYDLDLYEETLPNGLRVFIVPKDNVNGIHVTFSTKFGSMHSEFIPNGLKKMKKFPLGIAHFLEHKMFEQKDGIDPFNFYSERGCDANANTSSYKTTYLFSGTNSFTDNLNYLLDYIQSPYFTDENVEKEKGIIEQEIKMYDDEPFFKVYNGLMYNSFIKHPIRFPVAGTIEDVNSITKEDLYECYNTFYHPANMFLAITGNVDPEEAIETIRLNQENKKFEKFNDIVVKEYDEPNKVGKNIEKSKMDIEFPKLGIAYKIDCSKINKSIADIKTYIGTVFDLKLGFTSILNEKLKDQELITSDLDFSLVHTDKHILVIVIVETEYPNKVMELIDDELSNLSIDKEEFNRKKKVRKSGCIYRSDNIYAINNKIVSNIMNYNEIILDEYKKIDEFNMRDLNKIIKSISLENKTVYIINKS